MFDLATLDPALLYRLWLIGALLALSALFAGSEVALFSLTEIDIDRIKRRSGKTGARLAKMLGQPERLLVTIYIGNELTNVAISAVVTVVAIELFGSFGLAVAFGLATALLLLFGEITPKTIASQRNERWAIVATWPIYWFMTLIYPARELVYAISAVFVRLFGGSGALKRAPTGAELELLFEESADDGAIEPTERSMLRALFDLDETPLSEVMTRRGSIEAIDIDTPFEEARSQIVKMEFARAPLYRGSIDNIVGIFFKKDLLKYDPPFSEELTLESLAREPLMAPATMTISELMRRFKRSATHMAIALDEYGSVAGLVTLDDIINELLSSDAALSKSVIRLTENSWIVDGSLRLDEFEELTGLSIERDEIETVGGYIFHRLGRLARKRDEVRSGAILFQVEQVSSRAIKKVKVTVGSMARSEKGES